MRILLYSLVILLFIACKPETQFSEIPRIFEPTYEIVSGKTNDSLIILKFKFEDGDANIGLKQSETNPPFQFNFYVSYFELHNGAFEPVVISNGDTVNFNGRIPILNEDGSLVSLMGTIDHKVNISLNGADTVQFSYYILDRALNKSNVIVTEPIILNSN